MSRKASLLRRTNSAPLPRTYEEYTMSKEEVIAEIRKIRRTVQTNKPCKIPAVSVEKKQILDGYKELLSELLPL